MRFLWTVRLLFFFIIKSFSVVLLAIWFLTSRLKSGVGFEQRRLDSLVVSRYINIRISFNSEILKLYFYLYTTHPRLKSEQEITHLIPFWDPIREQPKHIFKIASAKAAEEWIFYKQ